MVSAQNKDSVTIYDKIKKICSKHKFSTWVYQAIFVDPKAQAYTIDPASPGKVIINPNLKFRGYQIKNITIKVYDPFGYSINDTIERKTTSLEKLGNRGHITTRHWVIINKLLFKEGDSVDVLAISESERLLRQSEFINDARISLNRIRNSDSVNVTVFVLDKWPITAPILISGKSGNLKFRNQNLFGIGQQFEQFVGYKPPSQMDYNGFYNVANIDNTYISGKLSYLTNKNGTSINLAFDRPFYSPLAQWAGGISLTHAQHFYQYVDTLDNLPKSISLNYYANDAWLGKSIKINNAKRFYSQSNNIIIGARFYNRTYFERPRIPDDLLLNNANTKSYIGSFGFAAQQYYKDKFIYRFGSNEDVPEGIIFQFTYGADKREFHQLRYYLGIEIARAKRFKFGYLTSTFSHGIFFNKSTSNNITTKYRLYYFSNLIRLRKWYLREFINCDLTYGENKPQTEVITLTSEELYGFNAGTLRGTKKLISNLETVAYTPYTLIGFKFAPVLLVGLGILGDKQNKLFKSNLYQAYSLGVMIRNENLLSSTFQFSIGIYPFLPNRENYLVTYNPVASFTLRVRAFTVSKPAFITY